MHCRAMCCNGGNHNIRARKGKEEKQLSHSSICRNIRSITENPPYSGESSKQETFWGFLLQLAEKVATGLFRLRFSAKHFAYVKMLLRFEKP